MVNCDIAIVYASIVVTFELTTFSILDEKMAEHNLVKKERLKRCVVELLRATSEGKWSGSSRNEDNSVCVGHVKRAYV